MCLKAQQTIYKKTDIFCEAYLIKVIFIVCLEKSFAGFMQIVCSHSNLSANNPRYEQYKFDSQKKKTNTPKHRQSLYISKYTAIECVQQEHVTWL